MEEEGERGKEEEQVLTHTDIDELRNNGNSSRWIRWVGWERVGTEMTGNFWILGNGELMGELLFIYLEVLTYAVQLEPGDCGAGSQWAHPGVNAVPSSSPSKSRHDAARTTNCPASLSMSLSRFVPSRPVIRRSENGPLDREFGEGAE